MPLTDRQSLTVIRLGRDIPPCVDELVGRLGDGCTVIDGEAALDKPELVNSTMAVLACDGVADDSEVSAAASLAIRILHFCSGKSEPVWIISQWQLFEQILDRAEHPDMLVHVPSDSSAESLAGRLEGLTDVQPLLQRLEHEVNRLSGAGELLAKRVDQIQHELYLARRVQHDFLPQKLPEVPPLHFSTLYRPANWVSGDMYDVFRLDEHMVGFFIADVVGHGLAAGLMTLFIKHALVGKKIDEQGYRILEPEEVVANLNRDLLEQELGDTHFVTVCYCRLNIRTLQMDYVRAGHPAPVVLKPTGHITELEPPGPVLGVFDEPSFESGSVQLSAGDKVVVFSDGVDIPGQQWGARGGTFMDMLGGMGRLSADELTSQIEYAWKHMAQDSVADIDDITVVSMEIDAQTGN